MVVRDLDAATSVYCERFGMELVGEEDLPHLGVRVAYLDSGGSLLQLLTPIGPGGVRDHLDASGEGLHHLCYAVPDIEATALQVGDKGETPLAELEARELGTHIERAIARLRPEYRSCIMLRHVEGLAYEEIAQLLDLPLGTVKTYIHRARHELRDMLAHLRD